MKTRWKEIDQINLLQFFIMLLQLHSWTFPHNDSNLQCHIEKQNNLRLLLLAERSERKKKRSCWVKKGRTSEWLRSSVVSVRHNSGSAQKSFVINWSLIYKTTTRMRAPISMETQVASFLCYISDEARYRKTANSFGISRASVSLIIRHVSNSIVKYLFSDYIKVPKSPKVVEHILKL